MYVSLEPCSFHGNTPACTNLIIESRIPRVVISTVDKTPGVNGEGIRILRAAGVDVVVGVLEEEGRELSRFRNHFVSKNRPFIILKFAESADGFIGVDGKQVWLSNNFSKRFVHKLRSSFDALMVGTGTVITDNPVLTNRYWYGRSPVRIIIDKNLVIPDSSRCYGSEARTIVFTAEEKLTKDNIEFVPLNFDKLFLRDLLTKLFERRITSLIVEGGRKTLQHFIDEDLWDEAIVISTTKMIYKGISAPRFSGVRIHQFRLQKDLITIFRNSLNGS
jgi:diaminohydroxyphosphoribosylaminopyrimidine deaminase/5-amino-6-(5-phosphoribosylamino)uracil reductase